MSPRRPVPPSRCTACVHLYHGHECIKGHIEDIDCADFKQFPSPFVRESGMRHDMCGPCVHYVPDGFMRATCALWHWPSSDRCSMFALPLDEALRPEYKKPRVLSRLHRWLHRKLEGAR